MERFAEAEAALREGHDILDDALGADHPKTVEAAQRLAAL